MTNHINMNHAELEFFISVIKGKKRYVEYGSGKSTQIAREYCESVVSLETDSEWADKTGAHHINLGETGAWGYPVQMPKVYMLCYYYSFAKDYDILFIDGRFRVGVALHAEPGEILIHHYDRKEYHILEKYMIKNMQVDRLALFRKTEITPISLELLTHPL